ncbi:MAG: hypothetical protein LBI65_03660, partial [Candidatus Symbiothrix sp.]|nr:hypothetical protein [Candidatus Symbiothrix sp.]
MRSNYCMGLLAAIALMFGSVNATAADYTAANENSFLAALNQASDWDRIIISGEIVLTATVTIDKNVFIVSDNDDEPFSASFAGDGNKLFVINPPAESNGYVVFKNIGFYDGNSTGEGDDFDGGAIRILSGRTEFAYCDFAKNYSSQDGGAIAIGGEGTYVRFYATAFMENEASARGGACCIGGTTTTLFEYCEISRNQTRNDRGGAFFIDNPAAVNFFYSTINGNISGYTLAGEDPTTMAGQGGAGFCLNGAVTVTLESSSVTNNTTPRNGSHGSAFFNMGDYNLTMINTTVAKNYTRGAGSMFNASGNSTLTLVNSNYSENYAYDNAGNGSGIRVMNANNKYNFFNSILVGNYVEEGDGATDMTWNNAAGIEDGLVIKNSLIGLIYGNGIS